MPVEKDIEPPEWLNGDYLYCLNYGGATMHMVGAAYLAINGRINDIERSRVTLLDRKVAHELHTALFDSIVVTRYLSSTNRTDLLVRLSKRTVCGTS